MKPKLALRMISDIMEWDDDSVAADEFDRLAMLVEYKYDHYHGFQAGSRFYVALMGWLGQFATIEERRVAYDFLVKQLIYVNQREMHHLVSLLMPLVDRELRRSIASQMGIPLYRTWIEQSAKQRMRNLLRRTLFVALSDGARIDVFRRYNEDKISNEQVVAAVEIAEDKWGKVNKELKESLQSMGVTDENEMYFERFCLIDDFTGSGFSFIRKDKDEWKGKVKRFVEIYGDFLKGVPGKPWPVHIHHHLASFNAAKSIEESLAEYQKEEPRFLFTSTFSYRLPAGIVIDDKSEAALVALIKKYYDCRIEDKKHTGPDIWFGYRRSGLPLILDHNTPNNAVALLWAQSPDSTCPTPMKPLFARRKRHSSNG